MNREQYTASISLEIDDNIARLVAKVDDDISEVWKIEKKDILEALNFKEQLIEYLEDCIRICQNDKKEFEKNYNVYHFEISDIKARLQTYEIILRKVRSGKYE